MTKASPVLVWGWVKRPGHVEAERIEKAIHHGRGRARRIAILSFLSNGNRLKCGDGIAGRDHDLKALARKGKIEFIRLECLIGDHPSSRLVYAVSKQEKE